MPTWPASLPQKPLLNSLKETPPDNTVRTQMEQGPDKVRQRFTAGIRQIQCEMTLTKTQMITLDSFFLNDIGGGVSVFDWSHPRTDAMESFRFVEPPSYSQMTKNAYSVSLNLEILP